MTKRSKWGGSLDHTFDATGFFRLERTNDRWWFVDPGGHGFLTIGVAHADESDLMYPHNLHIWEEKYGGSKERWIKEGLVEDLQDWGFNTIGWTQDYVGGGWREEFDWSQRVTVQQSVQWAPRDFEIADTPYVVLMRVAETEGWNADPVYPDVYSADFDDHCAFLARRFCVDHGDSENLLGYSFVDAPTWVQHVSGDDFPQLKGLGEKARDKKLYDIASKYFETIVTWIRKYDDNHLILGDLFNGNQPLPQPVLEAMKPYVDVAAVQYFPGHTEKARQEMKEHAEWVVSVTDKPLYIPDVGNWTPTEMNPNRTADPTGEHAGVATQAKRAEHYIETLDTVLTEPWFLGWHWCAYIENLARGWGIKDPYDEPYEDFVDPIAEYNKSVYDRL